MGNRLITSFSMEPSTENENLLKSLKILASKDGWNQSEIIRVALLEYVKRHSPGNPQLVLGHWSQNIPLPETLSHKHQWQVKSYSEGSWYECVCGEKQGFWR